MRFMIVAAGASGVLVAFTGCASKTKEQLATVRAENIDLRQRAQDSEQAYAKAQSDADAALVKVQDRERELEAIRTQSTANAQASAAAQQRLVTVEQELAAAR